ncbi:hypothetical protein A1Q2_03400 [Trichosporon asahii var. asahii CBS 8904]|uniref:Signal recognition particle subunit SRP68 n=1 Tax=Trichosporon asahii var. asahii (strain CBS 8904) TaxID=1220162 RepID=K1VZN0_TRIAC|nr:hypothetical protein A1Q2_03400 [Trichosporon asahii var. asahii CBS 8904]
MGKENPSLSFKRELRSCRAVYGLRNGDNERYRHHCANKLHRLRQSTGLTNGKGKQFKAAPALTPETVKDAKHLQLLLFSAERALAYSHELKALATKQGAPRTARKEQMSWLRKAAKYATELQDITSALAKNAASINFQTQAEVSIYYLSVKAELAFERAQYAEVLAALAARRELLNTLASAARDSHDQALAVEFSDAYDPLIRFSAYKLGNTSSHDIDAVVSDIEPAMREEALPGLAQLVEGLREETKAGEMEAGRRTLDEVVFAGQKVEFRSAEIVDAMLRVQDAQARLAKAQGGKGKGGMAAWDRLLGVLGDAEAVARRLLDDQVGAAGQSTAAAAAQTAHQYISFELLAHRIRRDLLLVDSLVGTTNALPEDPTAMKIAGGRARVEAAVKVLSGVVKLYDTVLQSMRQIRGLPLVEEREGARRAAEAVEAYYAATKAYTLARLQCLFPNPGYAAAVELLQSAQQSADTAARVLKEGGLAEEVVQLSPEQAAKLQQDVKALSLAAKRALFAQTVTKPVFFDSAFNYIDLPMEDLLELAGSAPPKVQQSQPAKPAPVPKAPARETRQATPSIEQQVQHQEEEEEEEEQQPQQKKGWLGGWFGRG